MAYYRKLPSGNWNVEVSKKGAKSQSATFPTKSQARAWATAVEADILAGKHGTVPDKLFSDLLIRYRDNVSTTKKGERWETVRIDKLLRDPIALIGLQYINASHVADWRDRRLKEISAASVLREWNLLSHVAAVAVKEWKWLKSNPFAEVKRPEKPEARWRRVRNDEVERLMLALGYEYDQPCKTATARVGAAFLFAIETGMRAGEICGLTPGRVFEKHVHLDKTKNGTKRDVPLSTEARRILNQVGGTFGVTSDQVDSLFRKGKKRCMIDDLHFHDARHEALTRMSTQLNVMELAKIAGLRDLRILQNVYYNPDIADIADKLS